MREIVAAVLLIVAFFAFMAAVIYFAEWLLVRVEAWALDRGLIEEEDEFSR